MTKYSPGDRVRQDFQFESVSNYWVIDEIKPARIHTQAPDGFAALAGVELRAEPNGRKSTPAWLLSAHLR